MSTRVRTLWLAATLAACEAPEVTPPVDTDEPVPTCEGAIAATVPGVDATDWSWRDPLTVVVTAPSDAYAIVVVDEEGAELPIVVTEDAGGLRYTVEVTGGLRPATRHLLRVTDCDGTTEVPFTTSELGLPIEGGVGTLAGRTWRLDLIHAEWVQPGGFGPMLASLVSQSFLIGTAAVDEDTLDLIGGFGGSNGEVIAQDLDYPTWEIPPQGFDEAPWFDVRAEDMRWVMNEWPMPIERFQMSGTFAPDGRTIGGMTVSGVMDTRELGGAIDDPDDDALCRFVADLGVTCIPCADEQPYCMTLDVRSLVAVEQPGVVIVPVPEP